MRNVFFRAAAAGLAVIFSVGAGHAQSASTAPERQPSFSECHAVDGQRVSTVPMTREMMEARSQAIAFASQSRHSAYTYYDSELFGRLSLYARAFIAEHECAHHLLGHTYDGMLRRENNVSMERRELHEFVLRKENDADVEAVYRMRQRFPDMTFEDLRAAIIEIEERNGADASALPWVRFRLETLRRAFDGDIGRPAPIVTLSASVPH